MTKEKITELHFRLEDSFKRLRFLAINAIDAEEKDCLKEINYRLETIDKNLAKILGDVEGIERDLVNRPARYPDRYPRREKLVV